MTQRDNAPSTLLSVLMPAYNAAPYLAAAIDSVLTQTHENFELLIIDDGSTDETRAIAEAYQDPRFKLIAHDNMGMGASLNKALALASSEWVVRMDADDIMVPNRLERQLAFVSRNTDLAVASCLFFFIDEAGQLLGKSSSPFTSREAVSNAVAGGSIIAFAHPGVIMRRSVVLQVGGYRPAFWPADDIDLWNRIVEQGHKLLVQPEHLLKYRLHGSSVSLAKAHTATLKTAWVQACMAARRSGRQEPSYEEFLVARRKSTLRERLSRRRRELASELYKAASLHYSRREPLRLVVYLAGTALLQPIATLRRAGQKAKERLEVRHG